MILHREPSEKEIHDIIEVYHKFPTKDITIEMLKEARKVSSLGLATCKNIINDYINKTYVLDSKR